MRADAEELAVLADVTPDGRYDPSDRQQAERLLKAFDVEITEDTGGLFDGWSVLWKYGGGVVCPVMPEEDARLLIALSCYLYLVGVDVSLTDTLAYWYVRGPKLLKAY